MYYPETKIIDLTEGEFVIPPGTQIADLSREQITRLLAGPSLRGRKVFGALFVLCVAGLVASLFKGPDRLGTLASVLFGGVCAFALYVLKDTPQIAARIATDPSQVNWAHPSISCAGRVDLAKGINHATLHLRDGQTLRVAMSRDWMLALFIWLRRQNPSIRLTGSPGASALARAKA